MKYKQIEDLTSDVLFEAYGKDLKEVFENSGFNFETTSTNKLVGIGSLFDSPRSR
jgi:SHS2 domain-containing protein